MNKLVRHNLVRGLPTKSFDNDHTYIACLKGKQHKASCKSKSKDETSDILKRFITKIENLKDLKVKIIMCDNGGEFRNKEINDFCSQKGIKREFSKARTPQHNGVAERRNKTLIEAARTMVADAKLPVTFWAEAVNTACPEFVLHKKPCFNYGDFSHLANDYRRMVQRETTRSQNYAYMGSSYRFAGHRPHGAPMRPPHKSVGHKPHGGSMRPSHKPAGHRPHGNISYLSDFDPFDGGYVSFGQGGCKITGKGTIKTGKLEFENVYL
nr:hypothetical protein [Tanacetum cinerariifolium]